MGFYYVYQHKPKGLPYDKHLNVSERYEDRDSAKKAKALHFSDKECVFSEIIEASSEEEVLQKVNADWLNRM